MSAESDRRGHTLALARWLVGSYEHELDPWRRWAKRSNCRMLVGQRGFVWPIRGIHDATMRALRANQARRCGRY